MNKECLRIVKYLENEKEGKGYIIGGFLREGEKKKKKKRKRFRREDLRVGSSGL
jgi:hypothetical protein